MKTRSSQGDSHIQRREGAMSAAGLPRVDRLARNAALK